MFGRPIDSPGKWERGGDVMVFLPNEIQHRDKVAAFDLDGTLITTNSGKVFPVNTADWKIWHDNVVPKLKDLYDKQNFKLVIFTNQLGLSLGKVDMMSFRKKIESIVKKIGVPVQVFVSVDEGKYRKPRTGMWEKLEREGNGSIHLDKEQSFYVGDSAGRHKTTKRPKKDHSFADRLFAQNIGLRFSTPEQFFLDEEEEEPWGPIPFDPKAWLAEERSALEPHDTRIPLGEQELIVMCGFPGSGKSFFAKKIEKEHGYVIANRDTLGTWKKCVDKARLALKEGKSVVVDNTNPDQDSRQRYITLAKELQVPVRCFVMTPDYNHASHNIKYRCIQSGAADVGRMVLRIHQSKYQKPELSEGFSAIVSVNPILDFASEEDKLVYLQYLIE